MMNDRIGPLAHYVSASCCITQAPQRFIHSEVSGTTSSPAFHTLGSVGDHRFLGIPHTRGRRGPQSALGVSVDNHQDHCTYQQEQSVSISFLQKKWGYNIIYILIRLI